MATAASLGSGLAMARQLPARRWVRRLPGFGLLAAALIEGTAPGGPRAAAFAPGTGAEAPDA
ncbi:MAG TPA: hypothetical protein VG412_08295 [Acidimicrobiales bacterium]|nr:hypothetical protein [Acidimicrobiales bacterium]